MPSVHYFYEDVDFKVSKPHKTTHWIKEVIKLEKKELNIINYIFCSDKYLLSLNKKYLNHNTYTDIITFDSSEEPDVISGDIFISIDRVLENSSQLRVSFPEELCRVMIHGVLHLIGHKDKSAKEKKGMRKREEAYLSLRQKGFT